MDSPAPKIPAILFANFHLMFAIMAPLIISGSWVEKMRMESFWVFILLWPLFVYYPLAHWIWNPGGW
jgi:ammonium transporter, Amt family